MDTAKIECLMKHSGATSNPSVPPNSWQWRTEPSAVLPLRYRIFFNLESDKLLTTIDLQV